MASTAQSVTLNVSKSSQDANNNRVDSNTQIMIGADGNEFDLNCVHLKNLLSLLYQCDQCHAYFLLNLELEKHKSLHEKSSEVSSARKECLTPRVITRSQPRTSRRSSSTAPSELIILDEEREAEIEEVLLD